jgi:hypothetical protein
MLTLRFSLSRLTAAEGSCFSVVYIFFCPQECFALFLDEKFNKNQVRNEAPTLKPYTWPAVPVCPTLFWTIENGTRLRFLKSRITYPIILPRRAAEAI